MRQFLMTERVDVTINDHKLLRVAETPDGWGLEISKGSHFCVRVSWGDLDTLRMMLAAAASESDRRIEAR